MRKFGEIDFVRYVFEPGEVFGEGRGIKGYGCEKKTAGCEVAANLNGLGKSSR